MGQSNRYSWRYYGIILLTNETTNYFLWQVVWFYVPACISVAIIRTPTNVKLGWDTDKKSCADICNLYFVWGEDGDGSCEDTSVGLLAFKWHLHWRDWCWSWNSNTLATWCEELTHLKRPWCWERLRVGGERKTEDEMVGWHHLHNGHGFGWTPGVGNGRWGLAHCGSWGHKESDMNEQLSDWTDKLTEVISMYWRKKMTGNDRHEAAYCRIAKLCENPKFYESYKFSMKGLKNTHIILTETEHRTWIQRTDFQRRFL